MQDPKVYVKVNKVKCSMLTAAWRDIGMFRKQVRNQTTDLDTYEGVFLRLPSSLSMRERIENKSFKAGRQNEQDLICRGG